MNRDIYRYEFTSDLPIDEATESLALAVLTVESLHGRTKVRLDASFKLDLKQRTCVVDASTDVGRDIACVFTGYLAREFGERAFRVHRLTKDIAPGAPAARATTHEK